MVYPVSGDDNDVTLNIIQESKIPAPVQALIEEYAEIFQTPTSLPPSREYDHHIALLPGAIPVNTRPYRYSPL